MDDAQTDATAGVDAESPPLGEASRRYRSSQDSGIYADGAEHILARFIEFAQARGRRRVGDLDHYFLTEYAEQLRKATTDEPSALPHGEKTPIAATTARTYYDVVSGFLTYCRRRGWLDTNPALREAPKQELPEEASDPTTQQRWTRRNRVNIVRWADWRAEDAIDHGWMDASTATRDRALVALLGYTGVRGGEVLRDRRDEKRSGLRWSNVDLENKSIRVWGKSRSWERVAVHSKAADFLRAHKRRQGPSSDDWPVFVTRHAYSLSKGLPDGVEADDYLEAYRDHDRAPQALTTNGGRRVLETLCLESGIRGSDGELLKPHAARRGLGKELYQQDPSRAQEQLRHQDIETTNKHYNDVEVGEQQESLDEMID